jgi:hypothetical protein
MKGFAAVFRREVLTRRLVFVAAAAASLVPFIGPLARGVHGDVAADERLSIAFIAAVAFAFGMAIGLGASMAAPAIANRQIAFDFARPLSSLDVSLGRAAAAWVLALGSAAIVMLPTLVAGGRFAPGDLVIDPRLERSWPLIVCAAVLPVFAASHALGVVTRSRAPLLALDCLLCGVAGLAAARVFGLLPPLLAARPLVLSALGLAIAAILALLAAGYASVDRGRTEIRAAHRALSAVFWSILGVSLAAAAAYAAWVRGASPRDLRGFFATPAARGAWVGLEGEARGARAAFLLDTSSNRSLRPLTVDWRGPVISADGRRAAWVDANLKGGSFEVFRSELDARAPKPIATRLALSGYPGLFVLSADGGRLATVLEGILSIHDPVAGRTLASARLRGEAIQASGFFVDPDRFRAYVQPFSGARGGNFEILELDVRTKTLARLGSRQLPGGGIYLAADRSGERLVTVEWSGKRAMLLDGRTGEEVATLADNAEMTSRWPRFLADGRIVLSESSPRGAVLRIFGARGRDERIVPLHARRAWLGGEVAPGRLAVSLGDDARDRWTACVVEVDTGSIRRLAEDAVPVAHPRLADPPNGAPEAGSDATRLFVRGNRELVRLDPETGQPRVILRAEAPKR